MWAGCGNDGSTATVSDTIPDHENIAEGNGTEDVTGDFKDPAFESAVRKMLKLDNDDPITKPACGKITDMDISGKGIKNLQGIENFTGLEDLDCYGNKLRGLDVSMCTGLERLNCLSNGLTSLDVSRCTRLKTLYCDSNKLTSLDVSRCTGLKDLSCGDNGLAGLDVSHCTKLEGLYYYGNKLTELDVSHCQSLEDLWCYSNELTGLDVSRCTSLEDLYCSDNGLTGLDVSGLSLTWLYCHLNNMETLDDIKGMVKGLDGKSFRFYPQNVTLTGSPGQGRKLTKCNASH